MPVRIRLQRHGKKGKPFYWIVAADSRSKRDGRYLEKLGVYNPNTNPASVEVDLEGAVKWLENGAQPSDTARTLLSYKGAMMKYHLNGGVRKGAFTQEEADKKLDSWLEEKQSKIQAKIHSLDKDKAEDLAKRLDSEKAINQKRITDLLAKPEVEENEGDTGEAVNEEAAVSVDANKEEASTELSANTEEVTEEVVASELPAGETVEEAPTSETIEEAPNAEKTKEATTAETIEKVPVEDTIEKAPAADEALSAEKNAEEEENKK
tara:strand:+ start:272 stop:1066 length:795 start_codon:yes stop_codon:yes gene_type:complete